MPTTHNTELLLPSGTPTFSVTGGSGVVSDIQVKDTNYIIVSNNTTNLVVRTSMDNPERDLIQSAYPQEIEVQVQRNSSGGTGTPTVTVEILEQSSSTVLATPISSISMGTIETPQIFTGQWNADILTSVSGSSVELRVTITTQGSGGNARSGNLGYIAWDSKQKRVIPIKAWDGSEWKTGPLTIWDGIDWALVESKLWDGVNWVEFDTE
jgi:hypothetical protein